MGLGPLAVQKNFMTQTLRKLGKGRSGEVFYAVDAAGDPTARKVFNHGDPLTRLVHMIFFGAPNPYAWNEDAVATAHYRRRVGAVLFDFWFGPSLSVAQSLRFGWDAQSKALELETEFVDGVHAALHHPYSGTREPELKYLTGTLMAPLQRHLMEAGFDGMVWQAGYGNPVAASNFMRRIGSNGEPRWVCIDLESGVPALFPANPVKLFTYYLPKSLANRSALFDDVDIAKLRRYLSDTESALRKKIGDEAYTELHRDVDALERHQDRWKKVSRVDTGIAYRLKAGDITPKQAGWFRRHPVFWVASEARRFAVDLLTLLFLRIPRRLVRWLASIRYRAVLKHLWLLTVSEQYGSAAARSYVDRRIDDWLERRQMSAEDAQRLRDRLGREKASPYVIDFFFHIALKPIEMAALPLWPVLALANVIGGVTAAILVALGGSISRTAYTLFRMMMTTLRPGAGPRIPRLIALLFGAIPTLGNLAYPMQMLYSTSKDDQEIGEFLLYDLCARLGERIPIWGGRDSETEHFFNRIPDVIIRHRERSRPA